MDQMNASFRVSRAAARDVRLSQVGDLADKLEAWAATAQSLSQNLEDNKANARAMREARKADRDALDAKIEDVKKSLKDGDLERAGTFDSMDVDRPKRRGKRSRMPFKCG